MKKHIQMIIDSWRQLSGSEELSEITSWIDEKNTSHKVSINRNKLSESDFWFYDKESGEIRNKNNSFFQVRGLKQYQDDELVLEQPILIQNEIGYIGIICKEIDGILKFLMQAKIEPGNVNKIQISPTLQATKSNFTQKHGGRKPAYLDYFLNVRPEDIIVDQVQSEQSSRFLGKRNRNIIIMVKEDIEVLPSHRWMSLGLLKQLLKIDNLVNMDTRTALSCIPYYPEECSADELKLFDNYFSDKALFHSIFKKFSNSDFIRVYNYLNDYKMMHSRENRIVPLTDLQSWVFNDNEIVHKTGYSFKVIFCDIDIEGREVSHWSQPLFEADGKAVFGLVTANFEGVKKFLVQAKTEAGCFDSIELAPTVQIESTVHESEYSFVDKLFFELLKNGAKIKNDVILSEEGGRFYHEQNRNVVIEVLPEMIPDLPNGYFWLDCRTLNGMVQYNNVLNIQLRNLLSLLEI